MADLTIEDYYKQLNLDPLTIEIYNKLRQDVLNDVWIHFGWRTLSVKSESAGGNKQEKLLKILKKGQEGIDAINESIVEVKPQYGGFVGTKREKDKGIVDPKGWVKHIKSLTTKTIKFKPQEIVDKSKKILEDKIAGGSVKQVTEFIEDDTDTEIFVLDEKPLDKAPENIWDDLEGYKIENVVLQQEIDDIDLLREGDKYSNYRTLLSFTNKYDAENVYQWQVGKPIYEQVDPEDPDTQGLVGYDRVGFEEILRDIEENIREHIEEGSSRNDLEDLLHEKYLVLQNKDLLENIPDNIVKSKDDLIEGFVIRNMEFGEYDDEVDKLLERGAYEESYNTDFLTKQQKKEMNAAKNPDSIFYRTFPLPEGHFYAEWRPPKMSDYLQKPYHNLSKEKLDIYLRTTDLDDTLSEGPRSFGIGPYDWKNHKSEEDLKAYHRRRGEARYELGIRGISSRNIHSAQVDYDPEQFADRRPGKWIYYDEERFYKQHIYQKLWVWDDGGGRVPPIKIKDSDSDSDSEDEPTPEQDLFLLSPDEYQKKYKLGDYMEIAEPFVSAFIESEIIVTEKKKEEEEDLVDVWTDSDDETDDPQETEEGYMISGTFNMDTPPTEPQIYRFPLRHPEKSTFNRNFPVPPTVIRVKGYFYKSDPRTEEGNGEEIVEAKTGYVVGYHYGGGGWKDPKSYIDPYKIKADFRKGVIPPAHGIAAFRKYHGMPDKTNDGNDSDSSDVSSLQSDSSDESILEGILEDEIEEDFKDIELKPVTPEFNPFDLSGLTDSDEDDPTVITTSLTSVQKLVKEIEKKLPKPFL